MSPTIAGSVAALAAFAASQAPAPPAPHADLAAPAPLPERGTIVSASGITHRFLAFGRRTRIVEGDGRISWHADEPSRDGRMLPDGTILVALAKGAAHPSGAVVVVDPRAPAGDGPRSPWPGTQSEVNTAIPLPGNHVLASEAGAHPRLVELDEARHEVRSIPLSCQVQDLHLQSRMARSLPNGNVLVPQLLDRVVREYTPKGEVAWEFRTPDEPKEAWPFTAIRLPGGNTLVTCTHANMVLEVDRAGTIVWKLTNDDLGARLINDACGAQRLPNGNTVICSYAIGEGGVKLLEVTPGKKVVWTYADTEPGGIHEVQVLDTNGVPVQGEPLR